MNFRSSGDSINIILQKIKTSISTIRRIISQFSKNIKRSENFSKVRLKDRLKQIRLQNRSQNLIILSQTKCFTSKDVQDHTKNTLSVTIPLHQI